MSFVCPACGATIPSSTKFCPHDGTPLQVVPAAPATTPTVNLLGTARTDVAVAVADPLMGTIIDGRYKIGVPLGVGGVGSVYEGEHVEMGKRVAVKTLHGALARTEEFLRRFEREARALSKLSHPGCVSVLDYGRVQKLEPDRDIEKVRNMPYLVMERVDGENLETKLAKGKLPVHEAMHIARGVLQALRHAHGLGIVHRDIKPGNIMLASSGDPEPLVKLLDFGLAKILGPEAQSEGEGRPLTQAGLVFGTPVYLSPEQAQAAPTSERSDLYSVSVVLFEMLCGRPPFENEMYLEIVRAHASQPPPKPRQYGAPGISPQLEAVVLRGLEKDPPKRFQTADEMLNALNACPESESLRRSSTMPVTLPPPASPPHATPFAGLGLPPWAPYAGMVGAVTALVLLFVLAFRKPTATAIPVPIPTAPLPIAQPTPAQRKLMVATEYQRRLWCSDAIEELERALREDVSLRDDPEVMRIAIACLTPKTQQKTVRFVVEKVGPSARPALERALEEETNVDIKKGAQKALDRLLPPAAPSPG